MSPFILADKKQDTLCCLRIKIHTFVLKYVADINFTFNTERSICLWVCVLVYLTLVSGVCPSDDQLGRREDQFSGTLSWDIVLKEVQRIETTAKKKRQEFLCNVKLWEGSPWAQQIGQCSALPPGLVETLVFPYCVFLISKCFIPPPHPRFVAIVKDLPRGIIAKSCHIKSQSNLCTVQLKLHHYTQS